MLVSISDSAREAGKQKAFGLIIFAQNQYMGYTLHLKFDEASLFLPRTANFPSLGTWVLTLLSAKMTQKPCSA
jgi:hypothetical protein